MTRPIITERNPTTLRWIDREMNDEEFAQWEIDQAQEIVDEDRRKVEEQRRKSNANELVKRLAQLVTLTEAEIADLLGLEV